MSARSEDAQRDWYCSGCGRPVTDEEHNTTPRQVCPTCGSTAHTTNQHCQAVAHAKAHLKLHSKHRDNKGKVVREEYHGEDYYRKTGKWSIMYRLIDRLNNWYEEIFHERDSGKIIHQKAHPLSEHHNDKK